MLEPAPSVIPEALDEMSHRYVRDGWQSWVYREKKELRVSGSILSGILVSILPDVRDIQFGIPNEEEPNPRVRFKTGNHPRPRRFCGKEEDGRQRGLRSG